MSGEAGFKLIIISLSLVLCSGARGKAPDYEAPYFGYRDSISSYRRAEMSDAVEFARAFGGNSSLQKRGYGHMLEMVQ